MLKCSRPAVTGMSLTRTQQDMCSQLQRRNWCVIDQKAYITHHWGFLWGDKNFGYESLLLTSVQVNKTTLWQRCLLFWMQHLTWRTPWGLYNVIHIDQPPGAKCWRVKMDKVWICRGKEKYWAQKRFLSYSRGPFRMVPKRTTERGKQ